MIGTILITWTLFVCTAGMPEKSKVAFSGITSRDQCANAARRVGFNEREFACVEVKTVVYLPVSALDAK